MPAPALAVLAVARITPEPMLAAPSAPNQPVPKLPLTTLRIVLFPATNENVPAPCTPAVLIWLASSGAATTPNCVPKVSTVAEPLGR